MNRPEDPVASRLEDAVPTRSASDELISIADIRRLFKLGRTAAYELTHRPGFPDHIEISPHCYRWWASEVYKFAATLHRERAQGGTPRVAKSRRPPESKMPPSRISGKVRAARVRKEAS